jgi:leader peptidase (prepilin peptidase)/N-methyltransferase
MAFLVFCFGFVFLVGLAIGSFINVCVARLPYEKSLLWPGSHCPLCFQPIRLRDNIPVLSFLLLRGRCRTCGARISWRYPLIELLTALIFVGLFYLEMVANILDLPMIAWHWGTVPAIPEPESLVVYLHHVILASFLLTASLCDLSDMEIPLSITVTGTIVGLALSTLFAWPYPSPVEIGPGAVAHRFGFQIQLPHGVHGWPVWMDVRTMTLPQWLPAGSWQLGLATGLAGALAGMILLRGVRFLFGLGRGKEGLGVGDADLMMMAGAFVGWQPVVLAFFVSVFPALFFAIGRLIIKGDQTLPFGPSLAVGVMITVLAWSRLGTHFQELFFNPVPLGLLGIAGGLSLLMVSFLLRIVRGGGGGGDSAKDSSVPPPPP